MKLPEAPAAIRRRPGFLMIALAIAISVIVPTAALAAKPPTPPPVTIQLLNVSDWHGNVDPVAGVGGAWNLSERFDEDRLAYPSLTLTAGDDYNASPPLSSFFDEVPSILAQRLMGIQVGAFGNHNFDRGTEHAQQMVDLARAPTSPTAPGDPFRYVSANMQFNGDITGVDKYRSFNVGGIRVAVIGITNEEAPNLVLPGAFGDIVITDGVTAANKIAKEASLNNDVVVVITHKGLTSLTPTPTGPLLDFANALNGNYVDVVLGDHTDIQYSATLPNGILVHENRSYGVGYAKTLLTVQRHKTGVAARSVVTSKTVSFITPSPAGTLSSNNTDCGALTYCDEAIVDMLVPYRTQLAALLDSTIGTTTEPYKRGGTPAIERSGETQIGNLVADAIRDRYQTQLSFSNSGGIRQQLPTCSYSPANTGLRRANWNTTVPSFTTITTCPGYAAGPPYDIVLGDAFAVLNFSNILNTRTVTGAQLWLAMEQGVRFIDASGNGADGRFPQISGFKFGFRYDIPSTCVGTPTTSCTISRVQWVTLPDGTPIPNSSSATYTLTLANFVNLGGDGYYMFNDGVGASQEIDWIVFSEYIKAHPNLNPTTDPLGRITECGSASCPAPVPPAP